MSRAPLLGFILVVLAAAAFWVYDLRVLRAGVPDPLDDTWEYGVVARHLLAGDGFRTSVIHPPLWSLRDSALTVPVLIHGPLMPLLIAPALAYAGPQVLDRIAWMAALFAALAAGFLWRLARRHFGAAVATSAAVLFTLAPTTLRAVHHDASLVIGACLLTVALDALARPRPRSLRAGLALGFACLGRAEMLLAVPILFPLVGRGRRTLFVLGLAACLLPWWIHNLHATTSPLFNLSSYLLVGYSKRWPELSVLRDFHLTPARWPQTLVESLPWLPEKWADFFPHAAKRALLAPSAATGWLAVIGGIAALWSRRTRGVAAVALGLAVIPVAVMTTTIYDERYLVPFLPVWALAAAVGISAPFARMPGWVRSLPVQVALMLLLILPATLPALRGWAAESRMLEARLARERQALRPLARSTPTRRVVFSDTPDFVAWSTRRPVLWLTRSEMSQTGVTGLVVATGAGGADTWFHAPEEIRPPAAATPR